MTKLSEVVLTIGVHADLAVPFVDGGNKVFMSLGRVLVYEHVWIVWKEKKKDTNCRVNGDKPIITHERLKLVS